MYWWLEVVTKKPNCIYYFGPFDSSKEAELEKSGYIEDLKKEKAEVIEARIKLHNPIQLTIDLDEPQMDEQMKIPA